jgi:putative nucleotidyltransferase with HDIG domain
MKKLALEFKSFRLKVTLLLILALFLISAMSNFIIGRFALNSQLNQFREKLKIVAKAATLMVDSDLLLQVPLNRDGINTTQFKTIAEALNRIKSIDPSIKYVYTLGKTDKKNTLQFMVDPEPISQEATSYPGDKYDASRCPDMLMGFLGPSADEKLTLDEWGATISGYAPIKDKFGKPVAILGIDIAAKDVYKLQEEIRIRMIWVMVISIFVAVLLGFLISVRINKPIRKILEGTRHLAYGDLRYRVGIKGKDEMAELASSFNEMAEVIFQSRIDLRNYFYRMVKTLVRIIEAKDSYTRGHSDRVADYSQKVALKMGFLEEKAESLREAALLHDIGKLGIHEQILNKREKLTDEEWELIKKHPSVGEEILKPVLLDKEMLSVIKSHHERYDGKGYPDKISGENINIVAQIVSVADAYDAMTSVRAYRVASTKEKAIEEIRKNSGIQFNPKVVEAFLKVLEEEPEA